MNHFTTPNPSHPQVQPAELDFNCAIRKFAPRSRERLPESFQPSADSVIIGKGKMPLRASGNKRLRVLIDSQLENYAKANLRREKTYIVTNILHTMQERCPVGAFVKFDGEKWWEVSDRVSRDKIASMFRDSLSAKYKSSNKNKVARRRAQRAEKRKARKKTEIPAISIPQPVSSTTCPTVTSSASAHLNNALPEPQLLPHASLMVLEDLDLSCMIDSVDRNVFDCEPSSVGVALY
eukprot:scaffold11571_cov122-Cylindrotheca_fusiformis.AAC.12